MTELSSLLPSEVRRELDELSAFVSRQRRQSLAELLRAWTRYADLVISQKAVALDDYRAMLFARDAIQDLVCRASLPTARLLDALVSHADSLFLVGTVKDDAGLLLAEHTEHRLGWWWHRIPRGMQTSDTS